MTRDKAAASMAAGRRRDGRNAAPVLGRDDDRAPADKGPNHRSSRHVCVLFGVHLDN